MSREDFALCTPDEFQAVYDSWYMREEMEMRRSWEVGRFVAAITLQPYSKKPIRPTDLIIFPWEKKESGKGAAAPKGVSTAERAKEILGRMEKVQESRVGLTPVGCKSDIANPENKGEAYEEQGTS